MEQKLTQIIADGFLQYSGAVLQSRALPDVRDCMKPSARQIFYCLYTDKFIHSKPYQKTLKAIGSAFRMYIHGDSSAEGVIMRAAQPFAMRYPLIEVEGSYGTLLSAASWSAPRYTSSRLTALAEHIFADINKDVIEEWRDNYDNTEQYPMVLPSKGFFNLVNGSYGIGVGASSSIPQYNLKELNNALCKLLKNPDITFDEIYCTPDFATGAILLNAEEVKESHKKGRGFACKLRSKVSYDSKERCFIVSEIPYMVYTETICKELEDIINSEENPGIDRFNDLTGKEPNIKIYLTRNANPDKVLKVLYKNTSLQSYYSVNFTMLENGRFPKVFGWKELLQAHINHEKEVYRRGFTFDLGKIEKRLLIIEGLLKAYDIIDEVIQTIKTAENAKSANSALQQLLNINEEQAKAILDLKLSRLSKLDINKLTKEQTDLEAEKDRINKILNNKDLFNQELINEWEYVAKKYGDERRTQILNLDTDGEETPIEIKSLLISFTNKNNLLVSESSSLYTQRRGGVGSKLKLEKGEYVVDSVTCQNTDTLLFFTLKGNVHSSVAGALAIDEKTPVEAIASINDLDRACAMTVLSKEQKKKHILFTTQKGMIKKSLLSDYNIKKTKTGLKAISLDSDDEIVSVNLINDENIGILTEKGQFLLCTTSNVRPIGRVAKGVRGIKLNDGDKVIASHLIPKDTKELISITKQGFSKRTSITEFNIQGRATKGGKLQKVDLEDGLIDFLPLKDEKNVIIVATSSQIKVNISEVRLLSKNTMGTKSIKIKSKDSVLKILL